MFAFCTLTNQKECGISDTSSTDMRVTAGFEAKSISTNSLRYTEGISHAESRTRSYDACYYELGGQITDAMKKAIEEAQTAAIQL